MSMLKFGFHSLPTSTYESSILDLAGRILMKNSLAYHSLGTLYDTRESMSVIFDLAGWI